MYIRSLQTYKVLITHQRVGIRKHTIGVTRQKEQRPGDRKGCPAIKNRNQVSVTDQKDQRPGRNSRPRTRHQEPRNKDTNEPRTRETKNQYK